MITIADVTYFPTFGDPLRVCSAKGRIFRVIPAGYQEFIKEFMSSPLYDELYNNHYIPKTSIAKDVDFGPDVLVLEHERLYVTTPNQWSFLQFKDAAIFLLKLQELCVKYGYYIADAHLNNIVFHRGKPIFMDFGSFQRGVMDEWYKEYWNEYFIQVNYLILSLWSKGQTYVCRSIVDEKRWKFSKLVPEQRFEYNNMLLPYHNRMVHKYDVYLKRDWPHLSLHSCSVIKLLNNISRMAQLLLNKPITWHCFKIKPKYKQCLIQDIDGLIFNGNANSYYPIEDDSPVMNVIEKLDSGILSPKSILLIGNYSIDAIKKMRTRYRGRIVIANDDVLYIDTIYKTVKEELLDINLVCANPLFMLRNEVDNIISDVVICNEAIKNRWITPMNTMAPGISRDIVISRLRSLANEIYSVDEKASESAEIQRVTREKWGGGKRLITYKMCA